MMISIKTELSMGHRLYGYPGKCANLHGHNYGFEFWISGNPDAALGLVMDFKELKQVVERVLEPFDHSMLLMDGDPFESALLANNSRHQILTVNPSAENIGSLMFNLLMNEGLRIGRIFVAETSDTSVKVGRVNRDVRILRGLII
jgi:6-pyruvoyltetrahydropterin/6-carboxytetrahydropterin synthase